MAATSPTKVVRFVDRAGWAAALGTTWAIGYFTIGLWTHSAPRLDFSTRFDTKIPFVGWAIWPYLLGIVGIALPVGIVRSPSLFVRTAIAYAIVIAASFMSFVLLPTDGTELRQHASVASLDPITARAISWIYAIDPPTNLLPSLHVSLATLAVIAISREYANFRPWAYVSWLIVAASVCAVKQHSIIDALAGAVLALAAFLLSGTIAAHASIRQSGRPRSTPP